MKQYIYKKEHTRDPPTLWGREVGTTVHTLGIGTAWGEAAPPHLWGSKSQYYSFCILSNAAVLTQFYYLSQAAAIVSSGASTLGTHNIGT